MDKNYDVITDFRKEGAFRHPHPWAAPKRLILNRVKVEEHSRSFPRLFRFDGFHSIFPWYGKFMGKPMYFTYYKVYHSGGKSTQVWVPISQVLLIRWVLLHFLVVWEIDVETHAFPKWWSMPYNGNLIGKSTHSMGKVWVSIFRTFPITWVLFCCIFPWWENPCISRMMTLADFFMWFQYCKWISSVENKGNLFWYCQFLKFVKYKGVSNDNFVF